MGTKQVSTPAVVLDYGTIDQLTDSTSAAVTQVIDVRPFDVVRLDVEAVDPSTGVNGVSVTISGSISGGTVFEDIVTSIVDQLSTTAANSKSVTSNMYTHMQLAAVTSTSATTTVPAAELIARTKWIGK